MRLICGLWNLDGIPVQENLLRKMAAQLTEPRLRPRLRVGRDGAVGLAVLDFARTDLPHSDLPQSGAAVIAADVRLDEPSAASGDDWPDRALMAALETSGPSGLAQLLGDFAFASWNRDAEELTCGRDVFGIRPLSYVRLPGKRFAFASFPKALYGSGIVAKTIDEVATARLLVDNYVGDDSPIVHVRRLPPAHTLKVTKHGMELVRYWRLDRSCVGSRRCSPEDAARQLRQRVDEAVRCRLSSNGEIGAHLSGGLDSSAISVLAARHLRQHGRTLHAYSFLDRPRNDIVLEDEREYVRAVLDQEGDMDWTAIAPPVVSQAPAASADADKVTAAYETDPELDVCAQAEKQGVDLILSGWGGDEGATFNGRGTLAELFLRGRWRTLAREVSALGKERGWSRARIVAREALTFFVPAPIAAMVRKLARRAPQYREIQNQALTAEMRARLANGRDEELGTAPDGRENRWRLITSAHLAERAEIWAQTGARHGVAFAFPLLDRRVVEFALSLPSELFVRGGFKRRPFRDAMVGVLPDKVRLRHEKFMPFPGMLLDLADGKADFAAQIAQLEKNPAVSRVIDFARLRRHLEKFPTPERAREEMRNLQNPAATAFMVSVVQALKLAAYLERHGSDQDSKGTT